MLLVANWKMNMTRAQIDDYVDVLSASAIWPTLEEAGIEIALAPSSVYLDHLVRVIRQKELPVRVIAQDVSTRTSGAFTGEVGVPNLLDIGVSGVILGHSERRRFFGETDEDVCDKADLCLRAGLMPIICFGESSSDRKSGKAFEVIKTQLQPVADRAGVLREDGVYTALFLAYEPIWAIGSGVVAGASDVCEVTAYGFDGFTWPERPKFLYGGSITADNIVEISACDKLSGFLVGSSWLDPKSLLRSAQKIASVIMEGSLSRREH